MVLYDALYAWCQQGQSHNWPPAMLGSTEQHPARGQHRLGGRRPRLGVIPA